MPTLALTEKLNSVKCVATRRKEGCAFMNALRTLKIFHYTSWINTYFVIRIIDYLCN